jgi:hypothetical protein
MVAFMKERYETNSSFSLLLWVRYTFNFLKANFPMDQTIKVVSALIKRGKRQEVKLMNSICVTELLSPRYDPLRKYFLLEG